jgi:ectoine hydroxylase-related dioxygenase (phytanoyl-CoA dioxygenase family)
VSTTGQLPAVGADVDQACRDLDEWGYCVFGPALTTDATATVRARLVEQAEAEAAAGIGRFDTGAHPSKHEGEGVNQRVFGLINKGSEFHDIALHPEALAMLEHVLGPRFLMTSFGANITAPGCEPQALHQDQGYITRPFPEYGLVCNVVWTLDDVDERNGGTTVVPGSHRWTDELTDPDHPAVTITAPAGTAILVDGRTYHAAGANRSAARRHVLLANYCRAWVRQQENYFFGLAPEVEPTLSPRLRQLLGFKTWGTLGGLSEPDAIDAEGYVRRPDHFTTRMSPDTTAATP